MSLVLSQYFVPQSCILVSNNLNLIMISVGNTINDAFLPAGNEENIHQRLVPVQNDIDLIELDEQIFNVIKNQFFLDFASREIGRSDIITEKHLILLDPKYDQDVLKMVYFASRSAGGIPLGATGVPLYLFVDTYVEKVRRAVADVAQSRREWKQTKEDIDIIDNEILKSIEDDPQHHALLSRPDVDQQMIMSTLAAAGSTGEVAAHILHVYVQLEKLAPEVREIIGAQAVLDGRPGAPVHLGSLGISASCQGQHVATAFADLKRDVSYPRRACASINEMLTFESSPTDANTEMQLEIILRHPHSRVPLHLGITSIDFRADGTDSGGVQMRPETSEGARVVMKVRWSQQKCKSLLERRDVQIKRLSELSVELQRGKNHLECLTKAFPIAEVSLQDKISRKVGQTLGKVLLASNPEQMSNTLTLALLVVASISCFARSDFLGLMLAAYIFHLNLDTEEWKKPEVYPRLMILCSLSVFVDFMWMVCFFFGWHWKDPEWVLFTVAKLSTFVGFGVKLLALAFFWKSMHDLKKRIQAMERVDDALNANANRI